MFSLVSLFIVGPLLGAIAVAPLALAQDWKWREKRALLWAGVGAEVLALLVASSIFGLATLPLSIPVLLCGASYLAYKNDPFFANLAGKACKRSLAALEVLVFGSPEDAHCGDSCEDFAQPAPAARPAETQAAKVRPATQEVPVPAICPMPRKPLSEQEVLEQLLREVARLQQWAARPEAERVALAQLTEQARSTESALNAAVEQLKTGTINWKDICAHIEGLKRHQLPAELSNSLDGLVAERAEKLDDTRHHVGDLSQQLRSTTGELKKKLDKPVLSPEQVINSADEALRAADAVSAEPEKQS